jgi:L-lactate dehydrogenase
MSVAHIIKTLGGNAETAMTVSTLHEGEYGIKDVCLSSLSLVGSSGVQSIITQNLSEEEMQKMRASSEALKAVIESVGL